MKLIKTTNAFLPYVAGFSNAHQCVTMAACPSYAKQFKTEAAAWRFVHKYVDAGYGLTFEGCEVIDRSTVIDE